MPRQHGTHGFWALLPGKMKVEVVCCVRKGKTRDTHTSSASSRSISASASKSPRLGSGSTWPALQDSAILPHLAGRGPTPSNSPTDRVRLPPSFPVNSCWHTGGLREVWRIKCETSISSRAASRKPREHDATRGDLCATSRPPDSALATAAHYFSILGPRAHCCWMTNFHDL